MTSCLVYKVMGLTFHDRINTQLIYRFELAQVVARRITKPQRLISLAALFYLFFFYFYFRGGGGLILLFATCLILFLLFIFYYYYFFLSFIPITCIRHIYKTYGTTETTVNSEIYAE